MNAWPAARGTPYAGLVARQLETMLVASTLQWLSPARWGDIVEVDVCLGRIVRVGEQECRVSTT